MGEFLMGKEYVVDHVSCNGVHKTLMVWVYDKRPTNGGDFVYYGMIPVDSASEEAQVLIKYTRTVLDALKLDNGPSHGEIMMTEDGPCLVEMNCRTHGGDGAWVPLARALAGYAQPELTLDSHMNEQAFSQIPDVMPSPFKASGQTVDLVSYFSGTVKAMPAFERMQKLPSFVALQTGVKVGSKVGLTVDALSRAGGLVLVNSDATQLEADIAEVREMEKLGLFVFEDEPESWTACSVNDLNTK